MIYNALLATVEHPTAEILYARLKSDNPELSLGTVYRNLNLLVDEGMAIKMDFASARYDATVKPHPHFICSKCGCVLDVVLDYDISLDEAAERLGYKVTEHQLLFCGICPNCQSGK